MSTAPVRAGMSRRRAGAIEAAIIGLCAAALVLVFQPFSKLLYGVGCVLVVVGGLAFNLVPIARPGVPVRAVLRAALIVVIVLLVVAALGIAAAMLYGLWLEASRAG